jgi:hypothetical protein
VSVVDVRTLQVFMRQKQVVYSCVVSTGTVNVDMLILCFNSVHLCIKVSGLLTGVILGSKPMFQDYYFFFLEGE